MTDTSAEDPGIGDTKPAHRPADPRHVGETLHAGRGAGWPVRATLARGEGRRQGRRRGGRDRGAGWRRRVLAGGGVMDAKARNAAARERARQDPEAVADAARRSATLPETLNLGEGIETRDGTTYVKIRTDLDESAAERAALVRDGGGKARRSGERPGDWELIRRACKWVSGAAIPWRVPSGNVQPWAIMTLRSLPGERPAALSDPVVFDVRLPPGAGKGPAVDRPALRKAVGGLWIGDASRYPVLSARDRRRIAFGPDSRLRRWTGTASADGSSCHGKRGRARAFAPGAAFVP